MSDKATPQESRDEAVHLIEQYQQTKDNDIATVLIKKYEPMVKMVARQDCGIGPTCTRICIRLAKWH